MPIVLGDSWEQQVVRAIAGKMPQEKAKRWETQAGRMFFKHCRARFHVDCVENAYKAMIGETSRLITKVEEGLNSGTQGLCQK